MKIEPLDEEFPWTTGPPRSEGLHMTPIITDILTTLGLAPNYGDDDPRLQFEKGYLWEDLLSLAFGEKAAYRPDEVVCDGIACSPDGIAFDPDGTTVLEEYKCTAMSSARDISEKLSWIMQMKGYCHVVETNHAILRVLYLSGNYRDIRVPQYICYRLYFSDRELDENWMSLVNHAKSKGWV